ncbi:MAG: SpoIID/LytB domain-containing protein [Rhodococcus sp.]|uniref:SpoIID/LytB domain-containing protein n=1 Tax=Rhodococcus TaxID=1827 RepID=UPI0016AA3F18|nr:MULTISPECIES: SpoIID/LytB domain-containing protein [Rhodococcus]NLV80205.1 SpoIID/LytB domain-containing protein [Rhodococcus sp. (in: high G+C Gram-positive bacteria)]
MTRRPIGNRGRIRRRRVVLGRPMRGGWRPSATRAAALGLAPALLAGAVVGAVVGNRGDDTDVTRAVSADTPITFTGFGHGHGRGMGQWGAYGYAQQGWTAERIVAHYYGGTTLGTVDNSMIAVRLTDHDDEGLDVYSETGLVVAGRRTEPGQAAHLTPVPGGGANVVVTAGCSGDVVWQGATDLPWVDPVDLGEDRPAEEHLRMCAGDTPYRGALGVVLDGDAARTVNRLPVEDYLRSVVPAESLPGWADSGGAEALRAQAIAARSYALAEKRSELWQTCDTVSCQVYGGSSVEDPRTDDAVRTTRGVVLMKDGQIIRSEFSASTGGYSAGGTFPAVEDLGDAAAPNQQWAKTITAGEIGSAFGVGELQSFDVLARNNLGADGGRVTQVRVVGSDRTIETTGAEARAKLGLRSDWFTVQEGMGSDVPPITPAPEVGPEVTTDPLGTTDGGSAIEAKYFELGGVESTLGPAVGPELTLPDETGKFRIFTGGAIVWTPELGAQVIDVSFLRDWFPGSGSADSAGEPEVVEPEVVEPQVVEPQVTEPATTDPDTTE